MAVMLAPRQYAAHMVKMSPETREKAMLRVPEHLRSLVAEHIRDWELRRAAR
jgi:hypothetical protein